MIVHNAPFIARAAGYAVPVSGAFARRVGLTRHRMRHRNQTDSSIVTENS
jgi:hypothetical protein